MSEFYTLQPGQDIAPGLPPVALPTVAGAPEPQQPLRIRVGGTPAQAPAPAADPFAGFPDAPPAAPEASKSAVDPWAGFSDTPPPKAAEKAPGRSVPGQEAAVRGIVNSLTFGFAPALAGLAEASGMPSAAKEPDEVDINPIRPVVGAAKLLHGWLLDHPDPEVRAAYDRGREAAMADQKLSSEQHPYAYVAGQLGGALVSPGFGVAANAASTGGRVLNSVRAGTAAGGLYGAGEATSEGQSPVDVAKGAAKGAATGAVFGGVGSGAAEIIGKGANTVASIVRGSRDVDAEAGRRVVGALRSDFERDGAKLGPEEIMAANAAGTPRAIMDAGGERTKALMRSSANTSPEGRAALTSVIEPRFEDQGTRVGGFIRQVTGGAHAGEDIEALRTAARAANEPAYRKVMDANPVVHVPADITERPVVAQAMKDAVSLAKNRGEKLSGPTETKTVLAGDGFHIADDITPQALTSLRYWDHVKKALDARINGIKRTGGIDSLDSKQKADLGGLLDAKRALVEHLDRVAPGYKEARSGAARFFGAEDAVEAGQKFVLSNASLHDARKALAGMSAPERELFARGFASELADKIEKTGFNRDVLKSIFLNNGPALQKIKIALGVERSRQVEALLRVEAVVDEARKALGNSTTARQLAEASLAGGGAVAAFEGLNENGFNPAHVIAGALTFGAARHGAKVIDQKVARRVGEILASNDPSVLAKGIQLVSARPVYFDALRTATAAGARVAAYDIGPAHAAAGAGAAAQALLNRMNKPSNHDHDSLMDQAAQ